MLSTLKAIANEIPGYIGSMSFRIEDDRDLFELSRRAGEAKMEMAKMEQSRIQVEGQFNTLLKQSEDIKQNMNKLATEVAELGLVKKSLNEKLVELNKAPEVNKVSIEETTKKIAEIDALILDKNKTYGQLKLELAPVNVRLDQVRNDLAIVTKRADDARNYFQTLSRQREDFKRDLIASIQFINREGAKRGEVDGSNDGMFLAQKMGKDYGSRDGDNDGLNQGTVDGQDRDYRGGLTQGDIEGSSRAKLDGERDGTIEGTRDGNISAASREGSIAGKNRADKSDASQVGTTQGKKAGLERAVSTGRTNGEAQGQSETVEKLENGQMNSVDLKGAFAGSFTRRSPSYPGDFNGGSYNPNVFNNREILRKAYADGYVFTYRDLTRARFNQIIDSEYNRFYDANYRSAYQEANSKVYQEYYNRGRADGDKRSYDRDYPIVRGQFYKIYLSKFDQNPNRTASEYKSTYTSSEDRAYKARYESIRADFFAKVEEETFNQNIAAQTEIFRVKRTNEVTKIFNENAVLKFIASEMLDNGINGVAKFDGIFQPNETTLHNLVIANFGFIDAQNVTVKTATGSVQLPTLPKRSIVKISGAAQSVISGNNGDTAKVSLQVVAKLNTTDSVEGIHFDNIGGGVLKSAEVKAVKVQYPFNLATLSLDGQLLKDVQNNLSISVANNSKREYKGELKVELLVNSQNNIILNELPIISTLGANSAQRISGAKVLVTNDADAYRDLDFSAKITQNGVVIGYLSQSLNTMAKAQYKDKAKLPVIIVNSDRNLNDLLKVISDAGGSDKVSILDLSLSQLNSGVLASGLIQKTAVVLDDQTASSTLSLDNFLKNTKSSFFIFADSAKNGLNQVTKLASLKDAKKLLLDKQTVLFSNPYRAEGLTSSSSFMQSSIDSYQNLLSLGSLMTPTANELTAKVAAEINRNNFFTAQTLLKVFSLRSLSEVLTINVAYDESGGIFNRNKKWPDMVENDGSLFLNALRNQASGDVNEAKLGLVLAGVAMKDVLSNATQNNWDISKELKMKIKSAMNKSLNKMEDGFKKSFKNFDKNLYNKAYEQASIHRPFYIEPPQNPNQ